MEGHAYDREADETDENKEDDHALCQVVGVVG